jgi:hypothetical protein
MKLDLAALKTRWQGRAVLALTLESSRLLVDLLKREGENTRVARSAVVPIGAHTVLSDPDAAGEALAEQLAGIPERRCVVCIPAGWALTTATDVPAVGAEDLRGYLELRAEREFPIAVNELRLSYSSYSLPDGKQRATLAAVPSKRLEAVERMLAVAGCRAVSISLGLESCLPNVETPAALHFLANGNHVDVVIGAGGGIAALRSLPALLKDGMVASDAAQFAREVRITLGGLPDALRQQVSEARFIGPSDSAENLCIEIRPQLRALGIKSRVERTENDDDSAAAGREAARRHLHEQPVAFEFVAPTVNRWQTLFTRFDNRRRRIAISAGAALILVPIVSFIVRSRIESSLEAQWQGMRRNVTELESLQQRIREFRPWFEPAPQSLRLMEGLVTAFPEQGDVWAKSIQLGEGNKVTCSGFAKTQAAWLGFLERLRGRADVAGLQVQQVRGENPVQFSVTYKWEPHDAK